MRTPLIIDSRRIFGWKEAVRRGFEYRSIGMGKSVLASIQTTRQKRKDKK